jgi:hypothetical protein
VSMVERIIARAETLDSQSFRGRRVPEYDRDDVREIAEHPYRIIYRIAADTVQVDLLALQQGFEVSRREFDALKREFEAMKRDFDALKRGLDELRAEVHRSVGGVIRQMYLAILGQMAVLLGFAYFFATHLR